MGTDLRLEDARWLLDWIDRTDRGQFSRRDAHRATPRGRFAKATDLEPALRLFEEHGYLRRVDPEPSRDPRGRGRPAGRPKMQREVCHHTPLVDSGDGLELETPTRLPRALRALAHEAVVTEDEPHRRVRVEPAAQPDTGLIFGGRATGVPFTAVLTGPGRTTMDNTKQPRRAPFAILAGDNSARTGFGSRVARSGLGSTVVIL
jgi:hypothetical protein